MIKGIIFDFHGTLAYKVRFSDSRKECELLRRKAWPRYLLSGMGSGL
jgi:hypothetical protein